ncbi:arylesterase [Rhodospira trueperi]|uniref:arylesterase n=1 Tax=Rhodospira trueperi TaxID=69960 RepID=UPI001C409C18|nr:arylesterase [Rhodospira trueperi]
MKLASLWFLSTWRGYGHARRWLKAVVVTLAFVTVLSAPAAAEDMRLMVLGDSLTAGYNLPQDKAFPVQLEQALRARDYPVTVLNAGISGDTTAGGRARLDWVLAEEPDAAIVALGANDGLRGLDPEQTRENLTAIVRRLKSQEIQVLIAGMLAPPNLGREYGEAFNAVFPEVAERTAVLLYPFFLKGVAADPTLNQADGLHPTADGVAVMVETILPKVEELLHKVDPCGCSWD